MLKTTKYDINLLIMFCKENNIELLEDYSDKKLNREIKITGKCLTNNCDKIFCKTFRQLFKNNGYCDNCCKHRGIIKKKHTCLEKYGVESVAQSKEIREKFTQTCLAKYGVKHPLQSKEIKEKFTQTCLEKYGVENPLLSNEIREKIKLTCLEKYGEYNLFKINEIQEKNKKTMNEKYGVSHSLQSEELMGKIKKSMINKYGVSHALQSPVLLQKMKKTNLDKYGVENPSQNQDIAQKQINNSYKSKLYTFPSGNQIKCQGYEPYGLNDILSDGILECDIITARNNVPTIWYIDKNNKTHRHYVDIYIPSQTKCIEIKSNWTFNIDKENILLKQESAKILGYKYEIWIYNNNGEKILSYT